MWSASMDDHLRFYGCKTAKLLCEGTIFHTDIFPCNLTNFTKLYKLFLWFVNGGFCTMNHTGQQGHSLKKYLKVIEAVAIAWDVNEIIYRSLKIICTYHFLNIFYCSRIYRNHENFVWILKTYFNSNFKVISYRLL